MIVSLIVAMGENRAIGFHGSLPWRLPSDLARFKQLTMGHHLIMGRKTYESIGRPLPGCTSIIVTRQADYKAEGCLVVTSIDEAL
ncbi:MAG TPA: dihydrofolate reductase, partial [Blastocatellia bacterium]|nr:dihydrofolate reductase [Blastocatellia bacterium]